jgi:hypothetical protein
MAFGLKKKSSDRELSDLVARRELLQQKLATARTAHEAATDVRRTSWLLGADLSDEEACRRRDQLCRDAKDAVESLSDALSEINSRISDAETRLASARDHAERAELARAVTADADALAGARAIFVEAGAKLISAAQAVAARVPINPQFASELASVVQTIPAAAVNELLDAARSHSAQVVAGSAPIRRNPVPQPVPEPPAPPVERSQIYALQNLKWREGSSQVCTARYTFADLPSHLATLAVERGLAGWAKSEHVQRVIESFGVSNAVTHEDLCTDLDHIDQSRQEPEPVFVETVGATRQMEIQVSRT